MKPIAFFAVDRNTNMKQMILASIGWVQDPDANTLNVKLWSNFHDIKLKCFQHTTKTKELGSLFKHIWRTP